MVNHIPQPSYKNAVVLYHWNQCGTCKEFETTFDSVVNEKKVAQIFAHQIFKIEVSKQRNELLALNVNLGEGVPKIMFYNSNGDEKEYMGDLDEESFRTAMYLHLMSITPKNITYPSIVLYFSHNCGWCKRFVPIYTKLVTANTGVKVSSIDTNVHRTALRELKEEAQSRGVPHVVFNSISGEQIPFQSERTIENLIDFIHTNNQTQLGGGGGKKRKPKKTSSTTPKRSVKFSARQRTDFRDKLSTALDTLQTVSEDQLGKAYWDFFEPDNASICFVGWAYDNNNNIPSSDKLCIMIIPHDDATSSGSIYPIFAVISGSRRSNMRVKIYQNQNPEKILKQKMRQGFKKAKQTDVLVQELRAMGYMVRIDIDN